ncbi:MAG TPA: response regulator transcription factor [Puia sp.]|nr:response regulator transcription factor [Puia sp.]
MRRFLIADDHSVVRKGLKQILLEAFPSAAIEEVTNAEDLYKKVMIEEWDVVISDISMPGRSGLEILQQVRQNHPKLPFLILSVHSEDQYAIRVLRAGASGYLNKDSATDELVKAVNQLLLGKKYITPTIAEKLATTLDQDAEKMPHEYLSDREFEVFKLLAAGRAVSEIAEKIFLSVTTVSTYRARIMIKMNLKTNADLTLYAIEHKLL